MPRLHDIVERLSDVLDSGDWPMADRTAEEVEEIRDELVEFVAEIGERAAAADLLRQFIDAYSFGSVNGSAHAALRTLYGHLSGRL